VHAVTIIAVLNSQAPLKLNFVLATARVDGYMQFYRLHGWPTMQNDEGDDKEVTESRPNVDPNPEVPRQQSPVAAAAADTSDALTSTSAVDQVDGDVTRRSNNTTNYAIDELLAGQPERVIELFHQLMTSLSTNSDTTMKSADNQTAADCVVNFDVSEIEDDVTFTLVPQVLRSKFRFFSDLRVCVCVLTCYIILVSTNDDRCRLNLLWLSFLRIH
jgi:hypothetical protein